MQPSPIRDFQFQLIGNGAMLQQDGQPPAFPPVASPGHPSTSPRPSTMQRPQSPARLSRRPLLDRLEQPQTQLMLEMCDETALSQATDNPASQKTPFGIATSHSQLSHVLHAVPPLECNAPEPAEFQMQVDTNASGPTPQDALDAMDFDGGPPLPWRNPFDESDGDAHSTTVSKFRLADVFAETAKVMEEWSKVERPQVPLPKRRRLPQANSQTTRAATKAPLHRPSPRAVAIPLDNHSADRSLRPPSIVVQTAMSNTAAALVLEPQSQSPAVAGRPVPCPKYIIQRIQRLQELARHGKAENGRQTGNPIPHPAVQSSSSSLPKIGYIGTVPPLPPSPLGGPSAHPHVPLVFHTSLAPTTPLIGDYESCQSIEQSVKGQISAARQTGRPATAIASGPPTAPSVCLPTSNSEALVSPHNVSEAPSAMVTPIPKETQSSTAVASLPLALPQQVKKEAIVMKLEPSSPKLQPPALPITVAGVSEPPAEATGRSLDVVPPATPLDQRTSAPLQDVPLTPPTGPLVGLPSFNVEAVLSPVTVEQKTPITASQSNTITESRPATPAPAVDSPSLGPTILWEALPPQIESTAMEMQMTQLGQTHFVPRTPPRQPNHTGPMYYSPAAPPLVSSYRRSASPPPRGQNSLRTRTPPRRVTPQSLLPRRRTPARTHPPSRPHPRYGISAQSYTDGHMHADSDGLGRRCRERIDSRINSYRPDYADGRLSGFGRENYLPPYELESRDRDRYHSRIMETGPILPTQHRRYPHSECHSYREPNELKWPHSNRGDLETSDHQAGSSRQRHPANENTPFPRLSTCIQSDTGLPSYPSAGSGPHSTGSSTHSRDMNLGSGRSEAPQVGSTVSPTDPGAPSVQIAGRALASKRPRDAESSPSLEGPIHLTMATSVTEPAPKRQKLNMTSSSRRTGGDSQTLVGTASYRLRGVTTHPLQETLIEDVMIPSTSQITLADRMGGLKSSSSTRQSPPGPTRGPLISRFSSGPTLNLVSQLTLENRGEVSPPTTTRTLLDRFVSDEESSNQARLHRGRGRGGRGRGIPPTEPAALRHQPLQNRLSGVTHIKHNSLLERMDY